MSNTKTYSVIRLFNHLLVILQILSVITLCILSVYHRDYFRIEELLHLPGLTLSRLILLVAFINLIIPFFGACAIDSKVRLYMKLFSVYVLLNVVINILVFLFVKTQLVRNFRAEFSRSITQESGIRMFIEDDYNCSLTTKPTCLELFVSVLNDASFKFLILLSTLIVLNISMAVLVRISLNIKLSKLPKTVPRIERPIVGFSTVSLRQKRLLQQTDSPTNSVAHEIDSVVSNNR